MLCWLVVRLKGLCTWYRNDFHSRMSFVPECSSYCIHMAKSTVGFLSCIFFFFTPKTKMVQVSRNMLLCLLMAISASLTNNLTIGLLLWAKQKRRTGLFTLSSNCSLANVNIFVKRRVQRRTRRSHWIRPGRTDLKMICMHHSPQTTQFVSERSSFSVYMLLEWTVMPEREFHLDWKSGWTHSEMACTGMKFHLGIMWTDTEEYMKMEWTRSGMKVIPVACKQSLRGRVILSLFKIVISLLVLPWTFQLKANDHVWTNFVYLFTC